jgi:DNA-binding response OmpR family regulator
MTPELNKCPCCGQSVVGGKVGLDLNENILRYDRHAIHLPKRLAELAFILIRRMPSSVSREAIIQQMWGDREPGFAESNINVAICQLRVRLEPIGLRIITSRGIGFRMAEVSRTEILKPMEQIYAQA